MVKNNLIEFPKDPPWKIWPSSRWCCTWMIIELLRMLQEEIYKHEYDNKRGKCKHCNANYNQAFPQCFRIRNEIPTNTEVSANNIHVRHSSSNIWKCNDICNSSGINITIHILKVASYRIYWYKRDLTCNQVSYPKLSTVII